MKVIGTPDEQIRCLLAKVAHGGNPQDRNESAAMTALRGQIIIDNKLFTIPVQVGKNLPEIIIGVKWLKLFNLVVDYPDVLTLEYKG